MSIHPATGEAETAVRHVLRSVYQAWKDNDADAFAELYTDDATVVLPEAFKSGKAAVRDYMVGTFAGPLKGSQGVDEPQVIRFVNASTAVVVSDAGIFLPGETELPGDRRRIATWFVTNVNDTWCITAYHNCPAH